MRKCFSPNSCFRWGDRRRPPRLAAAAKLEPENLRLQTVEKLRGQASGPIAPDISAATQPATPPSAPSDDELKPSDPATAAGTAFSAGYRRLQAGEQRLEGVLEQIECGVEDSAIFHVRTAGGSVRVPGRMKTIDFVAFRDDLSSHIGCGPLKPSLPVYLTWRNDPASESEKLVVAVEFLPK